MGEDNELAKTLDLIRQGQLNQAYNNSLLGLGASGIIHMATAGGINPPSWSSVNVPNYPQQQANHQPEADDSNLLLLLED